MEAINVSARNDRATYSFRMDNPSYEDKTQQDKTQESKNWFESLFY